MSSWRVVRGISMSKAVMTFSTLSLASRSSLMAVLVPPLVLVMPFPDVVVEYASLTFLWRDNRLSARASSES